MEDIECPKCGKIVTHRGFATHLKRSHPGDFSSEVDLKFYAVVVRNELSKEDVSRVATECEFDSVLAIKSRWNIPYNDVVVIIEMSGEQIRGISESCLLESVREKKRSVWMRRYGVDNPSKSEEVKRKKRSSFLEHYGVDNVFKSDEFKEHLNNLMLRKYGKSRVTNGKRISQSRQKFSQEKWEVISEKRRHTIKNWSKEKREKFSLNRSRITKECWERLSDDEKNRRVKLLQKNLGKYTSKLEERIQSILNRWMVSYARQFFIAGKSYDFKVGKIIIEINGDYWHGNPNKYEKDDILRFPQKEVVVGDLWKRDASKKKVAESYGYSVVYVWESEMKCDDDDLELLLYERMKDASNSEDSKKD